jgi:hypothetical protein
VSIAGLSAPAKQIYSGFAFVVFPFLVPDFDIPDLPCAAAKWNRSSTTAGANNLTDRQDFVSTIAEMDNDSFEADRAIRNSQFKCGKRSSPDFDFVVIRSAVYMSVAQMLPSAHRAPARTILSSHERRKAEQSQQKHAFSRELVN